MAAANKVDASEGKFKLVRYTGPKPQKQVSWVEGRPIWNTANNYTCEVGFTDAAKLIARCPEIFKVVESRDLPLEQPKAIAAAPPVAPDPVPEKKEFKRGKKPTDPDNSRLYGRQDGEAFGSEISAKSQIARVAKTHGMDDAKLVPVQTVEGWWLQVEKEADTGITEATLPDDLELTSATEGDDLQEG